MTTLRRPLSTALTALTALTLALTATACDTEDSAPNADAEERAVEIAGEGGCVALLAGQSIDAGTVCAAVDNAADTSATCGAGATGVLKVTYATTGGWELVEAHLAAGDDLADIPTNKKGNPKIGNFAYNSGDITGATEHSFAVPLCELGLDGADEVCEPVTAYLAAHAAVRKDNGEGGFETQTGWGDGDGFTDKGSWAEYFTLELSCNGEPEPEPEPSACETAFAFGGDAATCFIGADFDGNGEDDGIHRWGWSNGPVSAGTSTVWPVYAGAGQCDTDKGAHIGDLAVSYDGATATLEFQRVGDHVLNEEHLYVGSEPLPRDVNNEYTVAPGQYPLVVDLGGATTTSNTIDGLSGDIYVVYHGVACSSL
ncbi:MAG: hypothetical protein KC486_10220 [Myxococcales bacterium]|nr:hypothetical protein [Myxococcales bacterium]